MIPSQMAQTAEHTDTISVEELQRLVDEPQRCTLTDEYNDTVSRLPKIIQTLFHRPPDCDKPAVARYEIACEGHGTKEYWVCADHEIEIVRAYPSPCFDGHMVTLRRVD